MAVPPLLIAACIGLGFVLHGLAAWISAEPDPSFAHPIWLRLALAFGALAPAIFLSRWACGVTCWLWFATLAIVCALFAPGLTPYFLFPSLVAAPLLLALLQRGRGLPLFLAALAALTVWIGLNQGSEAIMGLRMHPLFMASAGFGLLAVLPLLKPAPGKASCLASLLCAVVLAVVAGLQPAYSDQKPERLNLRYAEMDGKAYWLADPVARLPPSLRAAADFSALPRPLANVGSFYVAPAGQAHFPPPRAAVRRQGGEVSLDIDAPGDGFVLLLPNGARLESVRLNDRDVPLVRPVAGIGCATPDCGRARLVLHWDSKTRGDVTLESYRYGLSGQGEGLLKARPSWAVPSQRGDVTVLLQKIAIPAGDLR